MDFLIYFFPNYQFLPHFLFCFFKTIRHEINRLEGCDWIFLVTCYCRVKGLFLWGVSKAILGITNYLIRFIGTNGISVIYTKVREIWFKRMLFANHLLMFSMYLQFTKWRQQPSPVCFEIIFLFAHPKFNGEPVTLKQMVKKILNNLFRFLYLSHLFYL